MPHDDIPEKSLQAFACGSPAERVQESQHVGVTSEKVQWDFTPTLIELIGLDRNGEGSIYRSRRGGAIPTMAGKSA